MCRRVQCQPAANVTWFAKYTRIAYAVKFHLRNTSMMNTGVPYLCYSVNCCCSGNFRIDNTFIRNIGIYNSYI